MFLSLFLSIKRSWIVQSVDATCDVCECECVSACKKATSIKAGEWKRGRKEEAEEEEREYNEV